MSEKIVATNRKARFEYFILESYEAYENQAICRNTVDKEIDTWQKIDTGYINYMKSVGIC